MTVSITIPKNVHAAGVQIAKKNHRSFSAEVEHLIWEKKEQARKKAARAAARKSA